MMRRGILTSLSLAVLCGCTDRSSLEPGRSLRPSDASNAKPAPTPNRKVTFALPLPGAALALVGDGLFQSLYTDGKCGISAQIFEPNPTQDAVLVTYSQNAPDQACAPYGSSATPRKVTINYGDGSASESLPVTVNVHDMGSVAVGETRLMFLGINYATAGRCSRMQFGGPDGGDRVWVARETATSWHVYSQTEANTSACVTNRKSVV